MLGFLWPQVKGGFGSKISLKLTDIKAEILKGSGFAYYPEGRMWITPYPRPRSTRRRRCTRAPELAGMEAGVVALYQKCVHLGCRVPPASRRSGSSARATARSTTGSVRRRAARRRAASTASPWRSPAASLTVDTGQIILGPPIGTNTTGQEAEGPHCVTGGEST